MPNHNPNPSLSVTPYPMLHSLGITNLETQMPAVSNLLSELVSIHKKAKQKLEFTYCNSKPGLLVPIPNAPMRKKKEGKSGLRVSYNL